MSRKISRNELLKNLKDVAEKLGRVPKKEDLRLAKGSKYGAAAYQREFGNISNAILSAGMRPHQRRGLDKQEVLDDIRRVYKQLGYTPKHNEYIQMGGVYVGYDPIKSRFGSWTNALIEAGIPVENVGKADRKFILRELRKWYVRHNGAPDCLTYWTLRKAKASRKFPMSCATIKNAFKGMTWEEIMKQIDPRYETDDKFKHKTTHVGKDGNVYKSKLELKAGNHLFQLKQNGRIADYRYEVRVCDSRQWTCDFVIDIQNESIWLEVDGLRSNRHVPYGPENDKIRYYMDNGLTHHILSYNNRSVEGFIDSLLNERFMVGPKAFDISVKGDGHVFFTKEEIYRYHQHHGKEAVFSDLVLPFYEYLLTYIDRYGWFYPEQTETLEDVLVKLRSKEGKLMSADRIGSAFIKSHFSSFWHASPGRLKTPITCVSRPAIMLPLLKYRFGISNSRPYRYVFDGEKVTFNELFDISLKSVRQSLEVNRCTVSLFKPIVAKFIYQRFGFEGMRVWDPCGGFGGRMLGFRGAFRGGTYIANEPNPSTCRELVELGRMMGGDSIVMPEAIEEASVQKDMDMVFTCPPYRFKEHYCDSPLQSDVRYKTEEAWNRGFLAVLLDKSLKSLNDNGVCVFVVDGAIRESIASLSQTMDFEISEILPIRNRNTHLNPKTNSEFCIVLRRL